MNKYVLSATFIFLLCLCTCHKADKTNSFQSNAISSTDVSIFYGVSSYAMFGADQQVSQELSDFYSTLKVIETNEKLDIQSAYHVTFGAGKSFWMDKNGVIWLDGDIICYKKVSGTMDYNRIAEIYEGSKVS